MPALLVDKENVGMTPTKVDMALKTPGSVSNASSVGSVQRRNNQDLFALAMRL